MIGITRYGNNLKYWNRTSREYKKWGVGRASEANAAIRFATSTKEKKKKKKGKQYLKLRHCLCITITKQTKIAADDIILIFYFYLLKKIRLDVSSASST